MSNNPDLSDTTVIDNGRVTGTRDREYDLVWFLQACPKNALRLEQYCADAEADGDTELAELFHKAPSDSKMGAEMAKDLSRARLSA